MKLSNTTVAYYCVFYDVLWQRRFDARVANVTSPKWRSW